MLQKIKNLSGARTFVEVGLTLGLAFVCSQLIWSLFSQRQFQPKESIAPLAQQTGFSNTQNTSLNLAILTETNPFSPRDIEGSLVNSAALDAPETGLNLTLKGVRANGEGQGVAFILLPNNRQVRAQVGTEILNGVAIEYVFEDRITLRTRGKLETLHLRRPESGVTGLIREKPPEKRPSRVSASGQDINPSDFLRNITLTPVRENGKRTGYRLSPKGNSDFFQNAGFESGDIIRRVNALSVSDLSNEDLFEALSRTQTASFDVERSGKPVRLSVRFAQGAP